MDFGIHPECSQIADFEQIGGSCDNGTWSHHAFEYDSVKWGDYRHPFTRLVGSRSCRARPLFGFQVVFRSKPEIAQMLGDPFDFSLGRDDCLFSDGQVGFSPLQLLQ